ncbi:MAG: NAD-dependent epimerase/dehydratase family protein [Acidimicrobiia bacterium]
MTVLVTGALGAIGSRVVRTLVEHGHRPVALDTRSDDELLRDIWSDFDFEVGDVRDWVTIGRVIREHGISEIVHMVAVLPDQAQLDPKLATEVNVGGTLVICELARAFGVRRVVFSSSKGVYRQVNDEHGHPTYVPLNEDYPIGPDGVYDVTKYAAEQLGLNYARSHGVDFVALRFAATYGPGRMARHGALAIRSSIIENAFFGKPTILEQGGDQLDDFVYTKDIAQALVKAIWAENLEHRIFNIGTGQASSLAAASDILRRRFPEATIEIGSGTGYGATGRYCIFDISRARRELGYEPEFDHQRGIDDYITQLERRTHRPIDE